ncbi:hypothetical protein JAAARDRAFT_50654 [Jaapia argillacea MUCL 33604]|uniref:Uncharacterized protein n=1 Tax=Jaapia argillacea MUCL 33604 TaxID=933084 RepID=A0A067P9U5_9AGAM|nr:hypothetical protein JAAARDRAFT_50654 [Jaapia argillacea MUCL 33604]
MDDLLGFFLRNWNVKGVLMFQKAEELAAHMKWNGDLPNDIGGFQRAVGEIMAELPDDERDKLQKVADDWNELGAPEVVKEAYSIQFYSQSFCNPQNINFLPISTAQKKGHKVIAAMLKHLKSRHRRLLQFVCMSDPKLTYVQGSPSVSSDTPALRRFLVTFPKWQENHTVDFENWHNAEVGKSVGDYRNKKRQEAVPLGLTLDGKPIIPSDENLPDNVAKLEAMLRDVMRYYYGEVALYEVLACSDITVPGVKKGKPGARVLWSKIIDEPAKWIEDRFFEGCTDLQEPSKWGKQNILQFLRNIWNTSSTPESFRLLFAPGPENPVSNSKGKSRVKSTKRSKGKKAHSQESDTESESESKSGNSEHDQENGSSKNTRKQKKLRKQNGPCSHSQEFIIAKTTQANEDARMDAEHTTAANEAEKERAARESERRAEEVMIAQAALLEVGRVEALEAQRMSILKAQEQAKVLEVKRRVDDEAEEAVMCADFEEELQRRMQIARWDRSQDRSQSNNTNVLRPGVIPNTRPGIGIIGIWTRSLATKSKDTTTWVLPPSAASKKATDLADTKREAAEKLASDHRQAAVKRAEEKRTVERERVLLQQAEAQKVIKERMELDAALEAHLRAAQASGSNGGGAALQPDATPLSTGSNPGSAPRSGSGPVPPRNPLTDIDVRMKRKVKELVTDTPMQSSQRVKIVPKAKDADALPPKPKVKRKKAAQR